MGRIVGADDFGGGLFQVRAPFVDRRAVIVAGGCDLLRQRLIGKVRIGKLGDIVTRTRHGTRGRGGFVRHRAVFRERGGNVTVRCGTGGTVRTPIIPDGVQIHELKTELRHIAVTVNDNALIDAALFHGGDLIRGSGSAVSKAGSRALLPEITRRALVARSRDRQRRRIPHADKGVFVAYARGGKAVFLRAHQIHGEAARGFLIAQAHGITVGLSGGQRIIQPEVFTHAAVVVKRDARHTGVVEFAAHVRFRKRKDAVNPRLTGRKKEGYASARRFDLHRRFGVQNDGRRVQAVNGKNDVRVGAEIVLGAAAKVSGAGHAFQRQGRCRFPGDLRRAERAGATVPGIAEHGPGGGFHLHLQREAAPGDHAQHRNAVLCVCGKAGVGDAHQLYGIGSDSGTVVEVRAVIIGLAGRQFVFQPEITARAAVVIKSQQRHIRGIQIGPYVRALCARKEAVKPRLGRGEAEKCVIPVRFDIYRGFHVQFDGLRDHAENGERDVRVGTELVHGAAVIKTGRAHVFQRQGGARFPGEAHAEVCPAILKPGIGDLPPLGGYGLHLQRNAAAGVGTEHRFAVLCGCAEAGVGDAHQLYGIAPRPVAGIVMGGKIVGLACRQLSFQPEITARAAVVVISKQRQIRGEQIGPYVRALCARKEAVQPRFGGGEAEKRVIPARCDIRRGFHIQFDGLRDHAVNGECDVRVRAELVLGAAVIKTGRGHVFQRQGGARLSGDARAVVCPGVLKPGIGDLPPLGGDRIHLQRDAAAGIYAEHRLPVLCLRGKAGVGDAHQLYGIAAGLCLKVVVRGKIIGHACRQLGFQPEIMARAAVVVAFEQVHIGVVKIGPHVLGRRHREKAVGCRFGGRKAEKDVFPGDVDIYGRFGVQRELQDQLRPGARHGRQQRAQQNGAEDQRKGSFDTVHGDPSVAVFVSSFLL